MDGNPFKLAGIVLLVIGVLDIALMVYTVSSGQDYSSSLNIFAVVAGALLLRSNARTARVVRWGSVFFCIMTIAGLFILLATTPEALFAVQYPIWTLSAPLCPTRK